MTSHSEQEIRWLRPLRLEAGAGDGTGGGPVYQGVLVAAGRVRTAAGGPGRHVVTPEAVRLAVEGRQFEGLPCLIDHAEPGRPSVRDLLGIWRDVRYDADQAAAVGTLRVYETDGTRPIIQLLDQALAGGGGLVPDLGVSLVFYPLLAADGQTVTRIVMVESADVVMFPAVEQCRLWKRKEHPMNEVSEKDHVTGGAEARGRVKEPGHAGETAARRQAEVAPLHLVAERPEEAAEATQLSLLEWTRSVQEMAAAAIIAASGLPLPVQERLRRGVYETPEAIDAAIEAARAELAAVTAPGIVRLNGRRPIAMSDPLDEARGLVSFFFGAAGAPTPPPNLRNFADLYIALTGDVYFRGVFDGGRVAFAGATTSTLPNLAVDAMNRVIVEQFQALDHYRWFERIVSVEPNDGSLQAMKWITLGGIANLPSVSEGAAYTELSVSDVKETAGFVKRGGYVGITREMIKNSDIMQLQAIPRALAAAALRTRSAAVAGLFTQSGGVGPTLAQDSKALFHLDHGNLATTALGTDATAWRAARSECFQVAEVGSGKPLGIFPRYLLVPAELYDAALSLLGYGEGMPVTYTPEAQGRGFADPRPVPLVVPEWTDATDWAYIVDPAVFPVIHMSYSQAPGGRRHPIPELFAVVSETSGLMFSNDVLPVKVRDEFALGVNGYRGIGKRNVA
jgi:hypothetical protein